MYGPFTNEQLVGGRSGPPRRGHPGHQVRQRAPARRQPGRHQRRPEYVRAACDASLRRLGVDHIDLYYQHRVDQRCRSRRPSARWPSWSRPARSATSGSPRRRPPPSARGHATHPITALQTEYSLFTRDLEDEILPTIRELGIGLVPYSPLGRGFLTGAITARHPRRDDSAAVADFPRFKGEALATPTSRWST